MVSAVLPNLRRAKDLADQKFDQPLDLKVLAEAAGFSKFHFSRAFAKTYGETPMRYVSRRRIERAQDLLRSANLSVTEISVLVGYNSLGSFTFRFTSMVGASPTEYRQHHHVSGARHIPGCFLFLRGIDAVKQTPAAVKPNPRRSRTYGPD